MGYMPFKDLTGTFIHHILISKTTLVGWFYSTGQRMYECHHVLAATCGTQGCTHAWHEDTMVLTGTWALGGDQMISH